MGPAGIPWEQEILLQFHGNGKQHGKGLMEWNAMKTLHFLISHQEQADKPKYTNGTKTGISENCPTLDVCIFNFIFSCF